MLVIRKSTGAEIRDTAVKRYAEIVATGKIVQWNEMRCYLERRLTSDKVARLKPRTLARWALPIEPAQWSRT